MNRAKLLGQARTHLGTIDAKFTLTGKFSFLTNSNERLETARRSVMFVTENGLTVFSKPPFNYTVSEIKYPSISSVLINKDVTGYGLEIMQNTGTKGYLRKIDNKAELDAAITYITTRIKV